MAAGGDTTAYRPPIYPLFLAAVYRTTGDSTTAARLLQAGIGTITVALIALVAWQLFGRRGVIVAAVLAAGYPALILVNNALLTETLSLPLQMAVLAFALEARRRTENQTMLAIACGLLLGLCILTRPANVALVPAVLLLLSLRGRVRIKEPVIALLVMTLALVPWAVRNQRSFREFVPVTTADAYILAGVYNESTDHDPVNRGIWRNNFAIPSQADLLRDPSLDESQVAAALRRQATDYMRSHPGYVAVVLTKNFVNLFDLGGFRHAEQASAAIGYSSWWSKVWVVSYWLMSLVAIAGLLTSRVRGVPRSVWLIPLGYVVATVVTLGTPRYRAPIEPFIVLLATAAIVTWIDRHQVAPSTSRGA